ncbi:MAG: DUF4214 domain-containing protein [Acidimicrobiales bacterium]
MDQTPAPHPAGTARIEAHPAARRDAGIDARHLGSRRARRAAPGARPARRSARRAATVALAAGVLGTGLAPLLATAPAAADVYVSERPMLVSRYPEGGVPGGPARNSAVSANGRFVAFMSLDPDLAPGDANTGPTGGDIFVRDRWSNTVERISVSSAEAGGNSFSDLPSISDDGRYVVFESDASNLVANDTNGAYDVFLRDRLAGTTTRVSVTSTGGQVNAPSYGATISGDGSTVGFFTAQDGVVPTDTNANFDVYVRDLKAKVTERVSVDSSEQGKSASSQDVSLSDDGKRVAFRSAGELDGGQAGANEDVYVRDRTAGTTTIVDVSSSEVLANQSAGWPLISGDGKVVVFASLANDLVPSDTNAKSDVFRRNLAAGTTDRVSINDNEAQLDDHSTPRAVSDNGGSILFDTKAKATAQADLGTDTDVFVRQTGLGSTLRVTSSSATPDANVDPAGDDLTDDGTGATFSAYGGFASDHAVGTNQQVYLRQSTNIGPFYDYAAFVQQQFQDFYGRAATAGEASGWAARFQDGSSTPVAMIADLATANDWAEFRGPVTRLYWAFFLRKPDPSGLAYWIAKYEAGTSLSAIAQKFAQSTEFKNRYGSVANQQYVKLVYQNVFEREPDPSGLAFWTKKLDAKTITRGGVIVAFSESSEGKRRLAPQVGTVLISLGMLRALPDKATWDAAMAAFDAGEKQPAVVAEAILRSNAYAARLP